MIERLVSIVAFSRNIFPFVLDCFFGNTSVSFFSNEVSLWLVNKTTSKATEKEPDIRNFNMHYSYAQITARETYFFINQDLDHVRLWILHRLCPSNGAHPAVAPPLFFCKRVSESVHQIIIEISRKKRTQQLAVFRRVFFKAWYSLRV